MAKKQKNGKVLIVDDEPDMVLVLGDFLAKEGFKVYTSHSGEQAIEKIKNEQIDMVLLDLAMPGMGGLETLVEIKKIKPETHVMMITAYRDAEKVVQAFRLGAFDCIFKPFDFKYLRESIFAKLLE
ncbi:MAG: response regulator [Elusimicrobia bacterium]|nr:response regulator [Elusimicrobiota bacterium]